MRYPDASAVFVKITVAKDVKCTICVYSPSHADTGRGLQTLQTIEVLHLLCNSGYPQKVSPGCSSSTHAYEL